MFEDVGKKIKSVAKGYFAVMLVVGIIAGIVMLVIGLDSYNGDTLICVGVITAIATPVFAWLSALLMYGFGEIVDTAILNRKPQASAPAPRAAAQHSKLANWCCPRCGNPLTVGETDDGILCCSQCQNRYIVEKKGLGRHLLKV